MIANAIPWWNIFAAVEYEWQVTGGTAVAIILGGLVLSVLLGFWAGKVASNKGKSFGAFFALGFFLTLFCGIGGIIVIIVAYAMSPAPGYEVAGRAPGTVPPPTPGQPYQQPPQPGTYAPPQAPPQPYPQQPQAPQYQQPQPPQPPQAAPLQPQAPPQAPTQAAPPPQAPQPPPAPPQAAPPQAAPPAPPAPPQDPGQGGGTPPPPPGT